MFIIERAKPHLLINCKQITSEPQVRSICNHVRPDRQTLLFSATFKKRVERLARDVLTDAVRIVQGDVGEANTDVTQVVTVLTQAAKLNWLTTNIVSFLSAGSLLIFVTKKVTNISFYRTEDEAKWI